MIVRYVAEVTGYVIDSRVTDFKIGDFNASLIFTEHEEFEQLLESVSIERRLSDDECSNFIENTHIGSSNDNEDQVTIGLPDSVSDDAIRKLQTIESLAGLHGLVKLDWRFPKLVFIPETENENQEIPIKKIDLDETRPISPKTWSFDLDGFNWGLIEELRVPLSFYRRGRQLQNDRDYINAFTNYYLILESLYADHWRGVEDQFLRSKELVHGTETMLPDIIEVMDNNITVFFEIYDLEINADDFLRLLVYVRNDLNHYFPDIGGPHTPNPFESESFEYLSKALESVIFYILQMKINEIEFS